MRPRLDRRPYVWDPASSDALRILRRVQPRLFDEQAEVDRAADPYAEKRAAGRRLAVEFGVEASEAFDLVIGYGSEQAARKAFIQRWWRGEVELREEAA